MASHEGRSVRSELRNLAVRMPRSSNYPESPLRRQRRRRTHQRIDSYGGVASRSARGDEREILPPSPSKTRPTNSENVRRSLQAPELQYSTSSRPPLSPEELAELAWLNRKHGWSEYDGVRQPAVEDDESHSEYYDDESDWDRRQQERETEERWREQRWREQREWERRREEARRTAEVEAVVGDVRVDNGRSAPENANYKGYQTNDKRAVSGGALEGGSEYYKEKDKWRDVKHAKGENVRYGSGDPKFDDYERRRKRSRNICIGIAVFVLVLVIVIPVAVFTTQNHSSDNGGDKRGSSGPPNSNLHNISHSSIPKWARGGYLDPFDWYDTLDFNVTFTDAKVGGLYVMGLNSTWDDDTRANENVPPLNEAWDYGTMPFRGINLGGWLSIEPFLTPSLFSDFDSSDGVVDEWTLSETLGAKQAKRTIEKHYSGWVQESTFAEIQAAGFDHIRVPFSYWAVTTYEGDPYVPMISWRYLLRGIEWARKYGLRINLDLHGAPGSQNGLNHSGHQGAIGWLNGTDGDLNAQRTIDIHKQLSTFFSQPRYKNIITMYGLVNEPKMTELPEKSVLDWSQKAITAIRGKGYAGLIVIGDGFLGLQDWQGKMQGIEGLVLDGHQYAIFDIGLLSLNHYDKINFACGGWTQQAINSVNTATGFGPTFFGEWSQADTDCTKYLNNVGVGSRWEGTLNMADTPGDTASGSVLTPSCPADKKSKCSCTPANADPSSYSDEYKKWLLTFAEAQMFSFEIGWGWFYWTWKTESAPQWSYKDGMAAGILPKVAYKRDWNCNMSIPAFSSEELPEYY